MENTTLLDIEAQGPGSVLEAIARREAQQMLAQAMEAEPAAVPRETRRRGGRELPPPGGAERAPAVAGVDHRDRLGSDQTTAGAPTASSPEAELRGLPVRFCTS